MHILCPHCRNPIEVVKLTPRDILSAGQHKGGERK